MAWLAATRLGLPSVGYYGGQIVEFVDEPLEVPVMLHFGAEDPVIPPEDVDKIRAAVKSVDQFLLFKSIKRPDHVAVKIVFQASVPGRKNI